MLNMINSNQPRETADVPFEMIITCTMVVTKSPSSILTLLTPFNVVLRLIPFKWSLRPLESSLSTAVYITQRNQPTLK